MESIYFYFKSFILHYFFHFDVFLGICTFLLILVILNDSRDWIRSSLICCCFLCSFGFATGINYRNVNTNYRVEWNWKKSLCCDHLAHTAAIWLWKCMFYLQLWFSVGGVLSSELSWNRGDAEWKKKGILVEANYTFYSQCCTHREQLTRTKQQRRRRRRRKKKSSKNGKWKRYIYAMKKIKFSVQSFFFTVSLCVFFLRCVRFLHCSILITCSALCHVVLFIWMLLHFFFSLLPFQVI